VRARPRAEDAGGLLHPSGGQIQYDGKSLQDVAAHRRVSMGMALVPEGRGIFARLTVAENLLMAHTPAAISMKLPRIWRACMNCFLVWRSGKTSWPHAVRRRAANGRDGARADEPPASADAGRTEHGTRPADVQKIFETISDIAAQGMSICW